MKKTGNVEKLVLPTDSSYTGQSYLAWHIFQTSSTGRAQNGSYARLKSMK